MLLFGCILEKPLWLIPGTSGSVIPRFPDSYHHACLWKVCHEAFVFLDDLLNFWFCCVRLRCHVLFIFWFAESFLKNLVFSEAETEKATETNSCSSHLLAHFPEITTVHFGQDWSWEGNLGLSLGQQESSYVSHHRCLLRGYISGKLKPGTGARNWTQELECGTRTS